MPRPPPPEAALSAAEAEALWLHSLRPAFVSILQGEDHRQLRFEDLYRPACTLVLHLQGAFLYTAVRDCLAQHLQGGVRERLREADDASLLPLLCAEYGRFELAMRLIRDVLTYLDEVWVRRRAREVQTVYPMGLALFDERLIRDDALHRRLTAVVLARAEEQAVASRESKDSTSTGSSAQSPAPSSSAALPPARLPDACVLMLTALKAARPPSELTRDDQIRSSLTRPATWSDVATLMSSHAAVEDGNVSRFSRQS
jgi:hypothetical protein